MGDRIHRRREHAAVVAGRSTPELQLFHRSQILLEDDVYTEFIDRAIAPKRRPHERSPRGLNGLMGL